MCSGSDRDIDSILLELDKKFSHTNLSDNVEDEMLKKLLDEFDNLNLCDSKPDTATPANILPYVIDCSLKLTALYQKTIKQTKENNIACRNLKEENAQLKKNILLHEREIARLENIIDIANRNLILAKVEQDTLRASKIQLLKELQNANKAIIVKENELKLKVNQLRIEKQNLKDITERNFGYFLSRDEATAQALQEYKINEEIYKDTIQKLQDNNNKLVEEVLNLKEEVVAVLYGAN